MASHQHAPDAIRPGELLTLAELQRRLGWGRHATRTARSEGLKVVLKGGCCFVLTDDVIEFFKSQAAAVQQAA